MYIDSSRRGFRDDLLMKVDKMSMAASVEARRPFLDHHVVEFVLGTTAPKVNRGISNSCEGRRLQSSFPWCLDYV